MLTRCCAANLIPMVMAVIIFGLLSGKRDSWRRAGLCAPAHLQWEQGQWDNALQEVKLFLRPTQRE